MNSRDRHLAQWIDRLSVDDQHQLNELLDLLSQILQEIPSLESVPESEAKRTGWGKAA